MENKTEKRRKILLGQFERNELTLYDFIRKYPEEYKNDSKYIDELWKTFGRYASERVGILIGGGSEKAREIWAYYILTALRSGKFLRMNTKTEKFYEKYCVEDSVVWVETKPEDFYCSVGDYTGFGQLFDPYCHGAGNFVKCNIITTPYWCDSFLSRLGELDEPSHAERRIQFRVNLDNMNLPLETCRNFQREAWHMNGEVYDILYRFSYVWSVFMENEDIQKEFGVSIDDFFGKFTG